MLITRKKFVDAMEFGKFRNDIVHIRCIIKVNVVFSRNVALCLHPRKRMKIAVETFCAPNRDFFSR